MKKWAKCLALFCLFLSPLFLVLEISGETAEAKICPIGEAVDGQGGCNEGGATKDDEWGTEESGFKKYVYSFVASLAGLSFGIASVAIVYGGFLYTTSGANEKNAKQSKIIILRAGVGIFMSALVFVFLNIIKTVVGW